MRIYNFFKRFIFRPKSPLTTNRIMSTEVIKKLMIQLENTRDLEISCDEVAVLMDQFAEASQRGEDVSRLLPLVQHHLDMCADCREEYEALLRILKATHTQTP